MRCCPLAVQSQLGSGGRGRLPVVRRAAVVIQAVRAPKLSEREISVLLKRQWLLSHPRSAAITTVRPTDAGLTIPDQDEFLVVRDDLMHPLLGGNKLRKLDGLWPQLINDGVTDVVTCGGLQSAHTTAVAAAAAEHGLRSHLLVRGEAPQVPTGFHLMSRLLAHAVVYITRADYANRLTLLDKHATTIGCSNPYAKVAIIHEGGAQPHALLGFIRLIHWLSTSSAGLPLPAATPYRIVIDSGTGVTAIGVALGIVLLGLPWSVKGVMLAGSHASYDALQQQLTGAFAQLFLAGIVAPNDVFTEAKLPLEWVPRVWPRKFGEVLPGDMPACKQVAQQHGVILDPIYSLASWEVACQLAHVNQAHEDIIGTCEHCTASAIPIASCDTAVTRPASSVAPANVSARLGPVVMLHNGGALGLHGLAQRYPEYF